MTTPQHEAKRQRSKSDIAIYVLSAMLLVTLGLASLYGWHYGNVDESVAAGNITVGDDSVDWFIFDINQDKNAKVNYCNQELKGKLKLAGAETDSILFQMTNIELADAGDSSDAILFIRMPRTGLQGNYAGPWMIYFSWQSQGIMRSDWVIANENGSASAGSKDGLNAMTAQRKQLVDMSAEVAWEKQGNRLVLSSEKRS